MIRPATPGAMKIPSGHKDRERLEALEIRLAQLEKRLAVLEAHAIGEAGSDPKPDKEALVDEAAALGIAARSTLARWGAEKLAAAISEAKG